MKVIREAQDVSKFADFINKEQESFVVMILNSRNTLIEQNLVSLGTVNACIIHAREVFKEAIRKNGVGIILVHNHPSGDPAPSDEDHKITKHLMKAGKLLGIDVLDHVIVGGDKYFSFLDEGLMDTGKKPIKATESGKNGKRKKSGSNKQKNKKSGANKRKTRQHRN